MTARPLSTSLILMSALTSLCSGEVFTSSEKILELVSEEKELLDALQAHINAEYDNLKALSGFLSERSKVARLLSSEISRAQAEHPNGAYNLIKLYTKEWGSLLSDNPLVQKRVSHLRSGLPTDSDYQGACSALLRLQRVYQLRAADMYSGNYSGYLGPPLQPDDAYEIGRQAFVDGFLEESRQWLHVAQRELQEEGRTTSAPESAPMDYPPSFKGQLCGLLGRAYYFMNDTKMAQRFYYEGRSFDSKAGDVVQLQRELDTHEAVSHYGFAAEDRWDRRVSQLCSRDKHHTVESLRPYHRCRYKAGAGTVAYVRYKEEILSTAPYVVLFHDIIHHSEIHSLIRFVKGTLSRSLVGHGKDIKPTHIRTSDLSWVYDDELEMAARLSARIGTITGLEVDQRLYAGPSSSEPFQVVNYGLGGHYDVHMDSFNVTDTEDAFLIDSGERLATFLIYLTDVEKGGNTIFIRSNISVTPKKGMALFWYNYNTRMDLDLDTHHAGCPVLVGHKWIANKWIWTYGNTFRRPCGLSPHSRQQELEPFMYPRHH